MAFEDQLDLLHDGGRSLREIDGWSAEKRSRFLDGFGVDHYPLFLEKGQAEGWFAAPATLAFRNLFYKARGHELLHNVSGIAESGTMTAVLGGAGNGTQALLEVLAQAQDSSNMSGVVLLDGVQVPRDFKQRVGASPRRQPALAANRPQSTPCMHAPSSPAQATSPSTTPTCPPSPCVRPCSSPPASASAPTCPCR